MLLRSIEPSLVAAEQALNEIADRAHANPTPWALGLLARCGALLACPAEAEKLYQDAISHLGNTRVVFDLGRAHLLYGEWLRRQQRRIDARTQLRLALDVFMSAGADGFAERTRSELKATGEHTQHRASNNKKNDLTPQERQIAELAAQRVTNREIAAKLFISAHTVDYHLRKIFNKLDICSRRELQDALRSSR